jgi:LCP family protein required for cell wall assembly
LVNYSNQSKKRQAKPQLALKKLPKRRKRHWFWWVSGFAGIAVLSAMAGALLAVTLVSTPLMQRRLSAKEAAVFTKGDRISTSSNLKLPELTRPVNILLLGTKVLTTDLENPPSELANLPYQALVNSFDGLTDTMLLLRFDPDSKKLVALSIPRDTRTYIPGFSVTKINAASKLGGPALSARAVSELLNGVGIERYVTINVQGVQALVDALGGVSVFIPKDMKYQDDSQHLYINLKAGRQHLNGDQALQLLRFRYDANGDIGRIQRQQMVMRALIEQALNPKNLTRIPKILSVIQSYVDTNLSVEELVALVGFTAKMERSDVQMLMVPGDFSEAGAYDASYWLPNPDRIQTMMAQYFDLGYSSTQQNDPEFLRVAIQDSTHQANAALELIDSLEKAGYNNVAIAEPYSEPLKTTRIVAQQGDVESAKAIRGALGFGEVRTETTGDLSSDVTIQLGQDWLQSYKQGVSRDAINRVSTD